MSDKILYIHIGSPKTGSTAIQNFCALNENWLRKNGVCYPKYKRFTLVNNHLDFSQWIVKAGESMHKKNSSAIKWKTQKKIKSYCLKLINEAKNCDSILLSGEEIFYAHDISVLKGLRNLFSKVKIIVYLRRQDQFVQSFYMQFFKKGKTQDKLQQHEYLTNEFWLDYYARVEAWAGLFGKENIIIRPFEKKQFHKANLLADFLHHGIGLKLTDSCAIPEPDRSNVRVDMDTIETVRLLNNLSIPRRQVRGILKRLQKFPTSRTNPDKLHSLLSPKESLDIIKRFDKGNMNIAKEYLGRENGMLFKDPLPDPIAQWTPYPGLTAEKTMQILLWLIAERKQGSNTKFKIKRIINRILQIRHKFFVS